MLKRKSGLALPEFQPVSGINEFPVEAAALQTTNETGLPVLVADHRVPEDGPDIIHVSAWSAGMELPYQKARIDALAHVIGGRIIAPNTPGQSIGSPELQKDEIEELKIGRAALLGKKVVSAAFEAVEDKPSEVHVSAISQGPLLVPGVLAALREREVDVKTVALFTPGSASTGVLSLFKNMITSGPKHMKDYRRQNPEYMQGLEDTNIIKSLWEQFKAHIVHFPRAMARQDLAGQLADEVNAFENKPAVTLLAAEHDKVSKLKDNQMLATELRARGVDVTLEVLRGQYHAVTEHVGYMASLLKRVVRR